MIACRCISRYTLPLLIGLVLTSASCSRKEEGAAQPVALAEKGEAKRGDAAPARPAEEKSRPAPSEVVVESAKQISLVADALMTTLVEKEKAYRDFQRNSPLVSGGGGITESRVQSLDAARMKLSLRRIEI